MVHDHGIHKYPWSLNFKSELQLAQKVNSEEDDDETALIDLAEGKIAFLRHDKMSDGDGCYGEGTLDCKAV